MRGRTVQVRLSSFSDPSEVSAATSSRDNLPTFPRGDVITFQVRSQPLAVAYLSDLDALDASVVGITTAYHVVTLPRPSVVTLERENVIGGRS